MMSAGKRKKQAAASGMHSGNGASRILSVRAKLLIYFACFAAVMLLIIWVC